MCLCHYLFLLRSILATISSVVHFIKLLQPYYVELRTSLLKTFIDTSRSSISLKLRASYCILKPKKFMKLTSSLPWCLMLRCFKPQGMTDSGRSNEPKTSFYKSCLSFEVRCHKRFQTLTFFIFNQLASVLMRCIALGPLQNDCGNAP